MSFLHRLIRYIAILLGSLLLWSCSKPAPLNVSFRPSYLDSAGQVLVVQNRSTKYLSCRMTVRNETHNSGKGYNFALGPGDSQSIGILESGWSFQTGEKVTISVEGFSSHKLKVP